MKFPFAVLYSCAACHRMKTGSIVDVPGINPHWFILLCLIIWRFTYPLSHRSWPLHSSKNPEHPPFPSRYGPFSFPTTCLALILLQSSWWWVNTVNVWQRLQTTPIFPFGCSQALCLLALVRRNNSQIHNSNWQILCLSWANRPLYPLAQRTEEFALGNH